MNPQAILQRIQEVTNTLLLVSGDHKKIIHSNLMDRANDPFDYWYPQNGNEGFAFTPLP